MSTPSLRRYIPTFSMRFNGMCIRTTPSSTVSAHLLRKELLTRIITVSVTPFIFVVAFSLTSRARRFVSNRDQSPEAAS